MTRAVLRAQFHARPGIVRLFITSGIAASHFWPNAEEAKWIGTILSLFWCWAM